MWSRRKFLLRLISHQVISLINKISWAVPLLSSHLISVQSKTARPGIPSLPFSLLILYTSVHTSPARPAKLKQETWICRIRFCFSSHQLPAYLSPIQPRNLIYSRTRYVGLCVYGSLRFGLQRCPPVFTILFTTGDNRPLGTLSIQYIQQFPGIITVLPDQHS